MRSRTLIPAAQEEEEVSQAAKVVRPVVGRPCVLTQSCCWHRAEAGTRTCRATGPATEGEGGREGEREIETEGERDGETVACPLTIDEARNQSGPGTTRGCTRLPPLRFPSDTSGSSQTGCYSPCCVESNRLA